MTTQSSQASLDDIPIGRDRAISRSDLARKWQMDDRSVRRCIHRLRAQHNTEHGPWAILSTSTGGIDGYWRSSDPDEIARYNAEVISRAKEVMQGWQAIPDA